MRAFFLYCSYRWFISVSRIKKQSSAQFSVLRCSKMPFPVSSFLRLLLIVSYYASFPGLNLMQCWSRLKILYIWSNISISKDRNLKCAWCKSLEWMTWLVPRRCHGGGLQRYKSSCEVHQTWRHGTGIHRGGLGYDVSSQLLHNALGKFPWSSPSLTCHEQSVIAISVH